MSMKTIKKNVENNKQLLYLEVQSTLTHVNKSRSGQILNCDF